MVEIMTDQISENILDTIRESLLVLDQGLRMVTISRSFYDFFKVKPEETVGQLIYDSATNSGISPNCGNYWKTSFLKRTPLTTMKLNTILPSSADVSHAVECPPD